LRELGIDAAGDRIEVLVGEPTLRSDKVAECIQRVLR
jgi:hypothetical protein